jgi:hypothetical protein
VSARWRGRGEVVGLFCDGHTSDGVLQPPPLPPPPTVYRMGDPGTGTMYAVVIAIIVYLYRDDAPR